MIVPYLDYGDVLFSTANIQKLDKLQRLQNKCLTICLNVHERTPSYTVHHTTGVAYLENRRISHLRNFMYTREEITRRIFRPKGYLYQKLYGTHFCN